ncbi:antirestriction protein [Enterobacter ludwigii]|jgi:antirestriction protein|nr:antirestriction protein [Enterobacter ludwigii]
MKPESVITALQNVAAQQLAESNQHITDKLCAFTAARDTHAANMQALKEIDTSIESCKQEQQTALNESAEAEQDWLVAGEKINYSSQDNDILTAIGFSR